MTAYCLWDVRSIDDQDAMNEYVARVTETVTAYGGEYVVVGGPWQIMEGDWRPAHPVVITFPSLERAHEWYSSEAYAPLRELRLGASTSDAVFFDGAAPRPLARAAEAALADVGLDLYREVHKGIRRGLFEAIQLVGSVDPLDAEALAESHDRVETLLHLLDVHAAHEDEFLGPLIERHLPVLAAQLHREHAELDQFTAELRRQLSGLDAVAGAVSTIERRLGQHRLYLTMTEFTAAYLEHQATEEAIVLPALNRSAELEELMEANARLIAAIAPEDMDRYMRLIVPAVNPLDLTELYHGMRAAAPVGAFVALLDIARDGLAADAFARLTNDLAGV